MQKVEKISEIQSVLNDCNLDSTLILFDIDNTIITTGSSFVKNIDRLKEIQKFFSEEDKQECNNLISKWRLKREIDLTDNDWPEFLNQLQNKSCFALTKMDVGKFGVIDSMEKWRYDELSSHKIFFNRKYPLKEINSSEIIATQIENATFFQGIFFTGNATKGSIVNALLQTQKYNHVFFVDDRIEQLKDVQKTCESAGVSYSLLQFIINNDKNDSINIESEIAILEFLKKHEEIS